MAAANRFSCKQLNWILYTNSIIITYIVQVYWVFVHIHIRSNRTKYLSLRVFFFNILASLNSTSQWFKVFWRIPYDSHTQRMNEKYTSSWREYFSFFFLLIIMMTSNDFDFSVIHTQSTTTTIKCPTQPACAMSE